jgi:hypothetical protein
MDFMKGMVNRNIFVFIYFYLILTFCGSTKEEWLHGENHFKYTKISENFKGMLVRKPTP